MPATFAFEAHSEADTDRLGRALARVFPQGVVALDGALGAGKTRLVQAAAEELGVERREVVSPTFVLIHEYHGATTIYHIDAYRLRDDDEFLALGVDEYFQPPNLVFIEWARRVERCLPDERLEIAISILAGDDRHFTFVAHGEGPTTALTKLGKELSAK